jgi:hypothetical protein
MTAAEFSESICIGIFIGIIGTIVGRAPGFFGSIVGARPARAPILVLARVVLYTWFTCTKTYVTNRGKGGRELARCT